LIDKTFAALGAISAFVGALVGALKYFRPTPPTLRIPGATIKRVLRSLGWAVGVGIVVYAIGLIIVTSHDGSTATASGTTITHPTSTPTSPTATSPPTAQPIKPIKFGFPHGGQPVGQELNVWGTGTIPKDKHLWIIVYAPDIKLFYSQGQATVDPITKRWLFSGVVLGGKASGDVHVFYTIFALLTDSRLSAAIQKDYNKSNGEVGHHQLPGGADPATVPHVTVPRTH
jgi:hypothetical protein